MLVLGFGSDLEITAGTYVVSVGSVCSLVLLKSAVCTLVPVTVGVYEPVRAVIVAPACVCSKPFASLSAARAAVVVFCLVYAFNLAYKIFCGSLLLVKGVGQSLAGGIGGGANLSTGGAGVVVLSRAGTGCRACKMLIILLIKAVAAFNVNVSCAVGDRDAVAILMLKLDIALYHRLAEGSIITYLKGNGEDISANGGFCGKGKCALVCCGVIVSKNCAAYVPSCFYKCQYAGIVFNLNGTCINV